MFALLVPVFLALGGVVIGIGNWYTHAKHLQTKADAAAFAGGNAWDFPCGASGGPVDQAIEAQARAYVGSHTDVTGTVHTTPYNPQVGGVGAGKVHVVLNGPDWYDNDSNPGATDWTSPAGSVCQSSVLDVKVTEDDSFPLASLIPLYPDIKRKARVQIEEVEGISGLLPIAVRVPKPLSAAAVFYSEDPSNYGTILSVRYFCQDDAILGLPSGLGGWSTYSSNTADPRCASTSWATVNVGPATGVVIATSFRPACNTPGVVGPCFDDNFTNVNTLCNQGTSTQVVQCSYATGTGTSQNVESGLQFIHGYPSGPGVTNGPPDVNNVWLDAASLGCSEYFNATTSSCGARLNAAIDLGSVMQGTPPVQTRTPAHAEVRYKIVYGKVGPSGSVCGTFPSTGCDLTPSWSTSVNFAALSGQNALAIRVRLNNTTIGTGPGAVTCPSGSTFSATCQWFFTGAGRSTNVPTDQFIFDNPLQRSFMGDPITSGAIVWLRLSQGNLVGGTCTPTFPADPRAASATNGMHCFYMEMGLRGGLSKDQDEPPIAFNISDTSQHQLLDCDPSINQGQIAEAVRRGCGPFYASNRFHTNPLCPDQANLFDLPNPGAPWDDWPPLRCMKTRPTATGNQLKDGFMDRFFGVGNTTCPADSSTGYVPGRNYWHRDNNLYDGTTYAWDGDGNPTLAKGNTLKPNDPRLVNLFLAPYDAFTSSGQGAYPIAGFASFYITGFGRTNGGGFQGGFSDPCTTGNDGNLLNGNGSEPPPDLDYSGNTFYIWGHFVKDVVPAAVTSGTTGVLCKPLISFMPCVAVLVE
jgi:Putative Flp pilus-assembly TadE/G-like